MKELRKKTNLTILFLLSAILFAALLMVNIRSYGRESEGVKRSLKILEEGRNFRGGIRPPMDRPDGERPDGERPDEEPPDGEPPRLKPRELENMMVMDYELYIVELEDGSIEKIFTLGNEPEDIDVNKAAGEIIEKESSDALYVGNLYFAKYSYRYRYMDSIVILNDREVRSKLWKGLIESLLLFAALELVIIFVSRLITGWIIKPAEEAFERQKEFVADASHELKTPLAVIMASADEIPLREENEKYIGDIRYESDRMKTLIAGMLNLSKLEGGADPAAYKDEDLTLILEKACLAFEGVAYEQGVLINTDIEQDMNIRCSREEIEQMISTLLDNAVYHSYRDSTIRVNAGTLKGKGSVEISVINSGDPIPKEEEEKIFERFYRSDKARSRNDNRYGLGLAIAKRIAKNHGGDITAHSENGDTEFKVILKK